MPSVEALRIATCALAVIMVVGISLVTTKFLIHADFSVLVKEQDPVSSSFGHDTVQVTIHRTSKATSSELEVPFKPIAISSSDSWKRSSRSGYPNSLIGLEKGVDEILQTSEEAPTLSGYIVVGGVQQQLAAAHGGFIQLADISAQWGMKVVEPFMKTDSSGIVGLPQQLHQCYHYGDFYNLTYVRWALDDCFKLQGRELIVSFQDFLVNSERQVVLLKFVKGPKNRPPVSNCLRSQSKLLSQTVKKLNSYFREEPEIQSKAMSLHGKNYKFEGIDALCVNGNNFSAKGIPFHLLSIAKKLHHDPVRHATKLPLTVVIPVWIGVFNTVTPFFYYDPNIGPWSLGKTCHLSTFPHGNKIKEAADEFTKTLGLSHPIVGVHLRVEKLARSFRMHPDLAPKCLKDFEKVVEFLKREHKVSPENIVMVHDYWKYGSSTHCRMGGCDAFMANLKAFLSHLGGIRIVHYEPEEFGEQPNPGFVSLVEKEFVSSNVDYLVTMGWGSFQRGLAELFLNKHSEEDFYHLCSNETRGTLRSLFNLSSRHSPFIRHSLKQRQIMLQP